MQLIKGQVPPAQGRKGHLPEKCFYTGRYCHSSYVCLKYLWKPLELLPVNTTWLCPPFNKADEFLLLGNSSTAHRLDLSACRVVLKAVYKYRSRLCVPGGVQVEYCSCNKIILGPKHNEDNIKRRPWVFNAHLQLLSENSILLYMSSKSRHNNSMLYIIFKILPQFSKYHTFVQRFQNTAKIVCTCHAQHQTRHWRRKNTGILYILSNSGVVISFIYYEPCTNIQTCISANIHMKFYHLKYILKKKS